MCTHWEAHAAEYSRKRRWSPVDVRMIEYLQNFSPGSLLEIGPGSGLVAAEIRRACPQLTYTGVDVAKSFLTPVQERLAGWGFWVQGSALELPCTSKSFDLLLEMDSIHHFPREVIPLAIREACRVLKSGGSFLLAEDWAFTPQNEREALILTLQARRTLTCTGHEYHPSETEWLATFELAGLVVQQKEYIARPIDFGLFEQIGDPHAERELVELHRLWTGEEPTVRMIIFQCRKR